MFSDQLIFRQELKEQLHCTPCWRHQSAGMTVNFNENIEFNPIMVLPCSPCRSKAVELEVVEGEAVCRWCSNPGGDGLACSKCDSHFCRKVFHLCLRCWCDFSLQCLNVNLGAGFIKLASASEGDWTCLLCKSAPLEKLRTNLLVGLQVNQSGL